MDQSSVFGGFYVVSFRSSRAATAQVKVGICQGSLCPQWTIDEGQSVPSCPFTSTRHSDGV